MNKTMRVEMEGSLESQGLARAVAAAYVSEFDPTMDELTEVKTAVSEAVSNVAIHGYPGEEKGTMILEFSQIAKDTIMIKISDRGVGISDVSQAMEPLFTTAETEDCSGMGFTVMESFMDKIKVESISGKGTTVSMLKKFDTYYGF